jgi:hypothetical protein
MDGNGVISLVLQSGLWVRGTTTLAPEARINSTFNGLSQSTLAGKVTGTGGIQKFGNGAITVLDGVDLGVCVARTEPEAGGGVAVDRG